MQVQYTRGQRGVCTRALNEKVECFLRIWKGCAGYDGSRVDLFSSHDEQAAKTGTVLVDVMSGLEYPVEGLCSWAVL
jgi:hypothetical protein